jgi:hypothetical protein
MIRPTENGLLQPAGSKNVRGRVLFIIIGLIPKKATSCTKITNVSLDETN